MQPGDAISVPVGPLGVVRHVGVVTDAVGPGGYHVLSTSRRTGQTREEPLAVFAQGQRVRVEHRLQSPLPRSVVIAHARSLIGTPWNLLTSNCEHTTRRALGLPKASPQLRAGLVAAAAILLVLGGLGSGGGAPA